MNNIIEYKGYFGKIEYSSEDNVLFGTILGINDLVTYEGETIQKVVDAFHDSVDDYLAYCKRIRKDLEKEQMA